MEYITFSGTHSFEDVMSMANDGQIAQIALEQALIQPDDACNIQFTSGTTGNPKAAELSHFNLVNNGADIAERLEFVAKPHRICVPNPFFHAFGLVAGLMASLHHGTTVVLPSAAYDVKATLRAITTEK